MLRDKKRKMGRTVKKMRICGILLALLLAGLILVPAVSAAGQNEGRIIGCNTTQLQVDRINELWGRNISIGEYDEQVCPQYLDGMPDDLKEILYNRQYKW